ncbi:hypothetical protein GCM10011576_25160 [Micromonospora parathelypteridis]|nr:hypothetical protein GCM10011576_25160 [Micromonospora parathelypteridis]
MRPPVRGLDQDGDRGRGPVRRLRPACGEQAGARGRCPVAFQAGDALVVVAGGGQSDEVFAESVGVQRCEYGAGIARRVAGAVTVDEPVRSRGAARAGRSTADVQGPGLQDAG